jgi:hypothetical protein
MADVLAAELPVLACSSERFTAGFLWPGTSNRFFFV